MDDPTREGEALECATALRRGFERARSLEFEEQIGECIDLLQNPEVIVGDVLDAYRTVSLCFAEEASYEAPKLEGAPRGAPATTFVEDYIWESRELMVLGDTCSFTCLATNVDPLDILRQTTDDEPGLSSGLDYVGFTCDQSATVVLGAVQSAGDATAYPLLLRVLACLTEMAPAPQFERMNEAHFMGLADPTRPFDLNLVLWDTEEQPEATPLSQLTRDLAERVKIGVLAAADFPTHLGDIVCLRMNPNRFDGRMRFDWRV